MSIFNGVTSASFHRSSMIGMRLHFKRWCLATLLCLPLSAFAQTITDTDGAFTISWSVTSGGPYNGSSAYITVAQTSPTYILISGNASPTGQTTQTRPNGTYVFQVHRC